MKYFDSQEDKCRACIHYGEERGKYAVLDNCNQWECDFIAKGDSDDRSAD